MAKAKTVFFCTECGGESPRWSGKCQHCGSWNTLVEEKLSRGDAEAKPGRVGIKAEKAQPLTSIAADGMLRMKTGSAELDVVLGGGLVPGSSLLLGGEPGIGKSTLLLQTAAEMTGYGNVLYISGEESLRQIRLRAERLNAADERIFLLAQTDIDAAAEQALELHPALLIIDSVQAMFSSQVESAPGSVTQVRAVAAAAISMARQTGAAVILVGHVTKEGQLAGPRVLEHMVDAVLYFEGERYNAFRLLRAVKNRFGSTNEVAVFEMAEQGLLPLVSPSSYFLSERRSQLPGSAVTCIMQGSRPLLLEVQALVAASSFGNARRLATGFDFNRLLLILAVLEQKLGLPLSKQDVYLNIAGGLRLDDPAADLAVAAAIVSSFKKQPLEEGVLLVGELGLLGELRSIGHEQRRAREGAAFGFSVLVCPKSRQEDDLKMRRLAVDNLAAALQILGL